MLRGNSGTCIPDGNFGAASKIANCYANVAAIRSEAQCVVDQISNGAIEQNRIGEYFCFTLTRDSDSSIFGERLIKIRDLLNCGAAIEHRRLDFLLGRISTGEKQKIVDDAGEA